MKGAVLEQHIPVPGSAMSAADADDPGVDALLRDRDAVLERIERGERLGELARTMALTVLGGGAVLGATLGLYRGGWQILFSAVKLPLILLLTAAIATPALVAMGVATRDRADARRDAALVLSSLALASLLVAATAPVILLAMRMGAPYHLLIMLVVGCCALGGAGGLALFARGLRRRTGPARMLVGVTLLLVFSVVGAQLSWTLRPYLVRPRTPEVVFVRSIEGSFLEAVSVSLDSVRGVYHQERAPLPGEEDTP